MSKATKNEVKRPSPRERREIEARARAALHFYKRRAAMWKKAPREYERGNLAHVAKLSALYSADVAAEAMR